MNSYSISSFLLPAAEFKQEEFVGREIEISGYLIQGLTISQMALKTGLNKKMLNAYLRNIMEKLKAANRDELILLITEKQFPGLQPADQLLKYKTMKQDKRCLQMISLTVGVVILFSLFFSIKYFTRFYEQKDQLEYLTKVPMQ